MEAAGEGEAILRECVTSHCLLYTSITFHRIKPAADLDVVMAAPRMIGKGVRELYEQGEGAPAFVGVHQDASGMALEYGKALCKAIGATRKGAIEVTFDDETCLDLMAEQGTWPVSYTHLRSKLSPR